MEGKLKTGTVKESITIMRTRWNFVPDQDELLPS